MWWQFQITTCDGKRKKKKEENNHMHNGNIVLQHTMVEEKKRKMEKNEEKKKWKLCRCLGFKARWCWKRKLKFINFKNLNSSKNGLNGFIPQLVHWWVLGHRALEFYLTLNLTIILKALCLKVCGLSLGS